MTRPIDAADEAFHPAGEDPYWMESAWFGFAIPGAGTSRSPASS
jgi:hypothetical protein